MPLRRLRKVGQRVVRLFAPHRGEAVRYKGLWLPPKSLRLCGAEFEDNAYFYRSALAEAQRLVEHFGLNRQSRVLDVGCGPGRLAIGILSAVGDIEEYVGVDVMKRVVDWCHRYITRYHPTYRFTWIDVENARYNPSGQPIGEDFQLPFADQHFDIIYLYSVFSHMLPEHVAAYLAEFRRLLAPAGGIFLTLFVEDNVPDVTVNPPDYRRSRWDSPLHCVRYSRPFFESLLAAHSLSIERLTYATETDGQSGLYIRHST